MYTNKLVIGFATLAAVSACVEVEKTSTPAPDRPAVGSEYDLSEFEGARAGSAEMGIKALGYEPTRTKGLTTWYFNRETGACARITTSEGRYSDITMLPAQDC